MPRAFLVKKRAKPGSGAIADEHHDKTDKKDSLAGLQHDGREKSRCGDILRYTTEVASEKEMSSIQRPKTLPCLTIPKPFADQTSNVLRSMLYRARGPNSPTTKLPDSHDDSAPSSSPARGLVMPRSAQPLTTSAHSAFDKVVPGTPRSRCSPSVSASPSHPTQNLKHISRLSQLQLEQLHHHERSQIVMMKHLDGLDSAALSFRQRGEDALRTGLAGIRSHVDLASQTSMEEPLNLKIKRDDDSSSRPNSVESATSNSRDSVSPSHSDGDHIPKKKYFLDRQSFQQRSDHDSPMQTNLNLLALRTPRYTPSVPTLGPNPPPSHLNWAYAAYYQQPPYGGPYSSFYSRLSQHPGIPDDIHNMLRHHQPSRPYHAYTSPINASPRIKKESPDSGKLSPSCTSPKPAPMKNDNSDTQSLKPPKTVDNSDAVDHEKSLLKPEYREYLTEHLKTIRSDPQAGITRTVARQPILGLEYIQNGTDVKVNDVGGDECQEDGEDEITGQESVSDLQKDLEQRTDDIDNEQGRKVLDNDMNGSFGGDMDFTQMGERHMLIPPVPAAPVKQPQPKKYKCDVCFKGFSRSNTLVTHKRIHTGDKPFKCELCGRAFRQPGNLTRHRLTHTTVKPYVCPQCDKAFNRASNLHTHMRTHTNYKPFTCPYCGKGFHQKIDMKIHSYTHTGEKPHKCKTCGRGFKQLTHLTYHMRTHSAVKMYTCAYCGKGFNQKGNLQTHIYGHTGERPYRCEICDKGFTLASTLNTHRRTHAEKKPFQCQYCQKDFYQKNALKSHLIASHPYTGESLL